MSNKIFSYTKRDYENSRKEGLAKIPQLSNGVWTDLNASDPGIIILDYVHALVDMINYYQDHQALETFITTAKERANIFRLAKQLSYKIKSAKGARVDVTFRSNLIYTETILIPRHTKLTTRDSINFVTLEDAYLKAGESEVTVSCIQGTIYEITYEGTGLSRFSNVEPPLNVNQSIILTSKNIDTDFITVTDNLGRTWSPVDFIVFSTDIDRAYQVDYTADDKVVIRFGDGERGVVPKETDILTIRYLATDAESGKVGINAIVNTAPIYHNGKYISLEVTNKEESIGGYAPQSSTSIRESAPGIIKAQDRAVTLTDFENLAKSVPGVYDAKAYDVNTHPDIPYHEVRVFIIPEVSHNSNHLLVDDVYKYLYNRMIPSTMLSVSLPSDIVIDIDIKVKRLSDIDKSIVEYQVRSVIEEYFNDRLHTIGEEFYPTDLLIKVSQIPYVSRVLSMTPNTSILIEDFSRAKLGELSIEVE